MTASDKTEKLDPPMPEDPSPAQPRPPRSFDDVGQSGVQDLRERFALG